MIFKGVLKNLFGNRWSLQKWLGKWFSISGAIKNYLFDNVLLIQQNTQGQMCDLNLVLFSLAHKPYYVMI